MNNMNENGQTKNTTHENVIAGIVGAFLFSLAGGALWFGLYMIGFMAGISGLVGVVCAIKGYSIFAKKESTKGIVISVIITLIVMVFAWYLCLSYDVYDAYKLWYEEGSVDFTLTFFESARVAYMFLEEPEIASSYFLDLGLGLLLCLVGAGSYVATKIKKVKMEKKAAANVVYTAPAAEVTDVPVEAPIEAPEAPSEPAETSEGEEKSE